jgi:hypothetical protein
MRHFRVVLLDKEAMLERAPPGLDGRVREGDIKLREHAPKLRGRESCVDRAGDVFDSGVGDDRQGGCAVG